MLAMQQIRIAVGSFPKTTKNIGKKNKTNPVNLLDIVCKNEICRYFIYPIMIERHRISAIIIIQMRIHCGRFIMGIRMSSTIPIKIKSATLSKTWPNLPETPKRLARYPSKASLIPQTIYRKKNKDDRGLTNIKPMDARILAIDI